MDLGARKMASASLTTSNATTTKRPLVSIGVPAYNGAGHITEALESALAQDYTPLEVIVVDDASTDDTETICRRFAAADRRIRYVRNGRNLGAVANFRRVLMMARGTYFTWLAQDDVLIARQYVGTLVDYLERAPDVVACTSEFYALDHEFPGSRTAMNLPGIDHDIPWSDARRELFRWPQSDAYLAIYSMYRRDALLGVPIVARWYRGRPRSAWWEMPVLTALSGQGRIVAIPGCPRGKRSSSSSDGWRTYLTTSPFDLFVLGIWTKLDLIRSAVRLPVPVQERIGLLQLTLQNMFRANLQRPYDISVVTDLRRKELMELQRVAEERSQLIESLRAAIHARREILYGHDRPTTGRDVTGPAAILPVEATPISAGSPLVRALDRFDATRGSLLSFFRRTPDWLAALCQQLNDEIAMRRRICDAQLMQISHLHDEADSLLSEMTGGIPGAVVQDSPPRELLGDDSVADCEQQQARSFAGGPSSDPKHTPAIHSSLTKRLRSWVQQGGHRIHCAGRSYISVLWSMFDAISEIRSARRERDMLAARVNELQAQLTAKSPEAQTPAEEEMTGQARARMLAANESAGWARAQELDKELQEAWAHAHKLNDALAAEQAYLRSAAYNADALAVWYKDVAFLRDQRFIDAYTAGMQSGHQIQRPAGSTDDIHIEWRVHVICWAAQHAKHLEGSFVECGVNTGIYALAACHYIDFNALNKDFFLFDTFAGIPDRQVHEFERPLVEQVNDSYYPECHAVAERNFAKYPRARLIRGIVPDTLAHVEIDRVCFLSLDMNIAEPEIAALEFFWPRLVSGAVVILDDYGWVRHRLQKEMADNFAREKQIEILLLPTGQGLILKP